MFGVAQSWHCPIVENVVPTQLMHCVLSSLGPVPAGHAEHVVRSALTTFGSLHSVHSIPKPEYVVPAHASQVERFALGALPAKHASQKVCSSFATLPGSVHGWHRPPEVLTVPIWHTLQSSCPSQPLDLVHSVPAAHSDGSIHAVLSPFTTRGPKHSVHTPKVEYQPSPQPTQLAESECGPVPAGHAEHVVRSALTTFGGSQATQSCPKPEYAVPVHATQAVRLAFGSSPGAHELQL